MSNQEVKDNIALALGLAIATNPDQQVFPLSRGVVEVLLKETLELSEENRKLKEALTPSGNTKGYHIGGSTHSLEQ